jgi:hypothetical protein
MDVLRGTLTLTRRTEATYRTDSIDPRSRPDEHPVLLGATRQGLEYSQTELRRHGAVGAAGDRRPSPPPCPRRGHATRYPTSTGPWSSPAAQVGDCPQPQTAGVTSAGAVAATSDEAVATRTPSQCGPRLRSHGFARAVLCQSYAIEDKQKGPRLPRDPYDLLFRWWRGRDLNPRPSGYEFDGPVRRGTARCASVLVSASFASGRFGSLTTRLGRFV